MKYYEREDSERIVEVSRKNGHTITLDQAYNIWSSKSESLASGWLSVPDQDDRLWNGIKSEVSEITEYQKKIDKLIKLENENARLKRKVNRLLKKNTNLKEQLEICKH